jgi:ketosteroid isomerase-like protein
MKKFFLLCVAILIVASQLYAQGEGDLKAKFNDMNKKFAKMMVDGDHDAMLSWYTDDLISMPSYQPMIKGIDELKKAQEMDKKMGMKITAFTIETTDVIEAGDYVVEIGLYTISMEMPGMGPIDDNGKYMNVWEKQDDGSMKIKADIWNTDMNPWMKMGDHDGSGKHEGMDMEKDHK